MSDPQHPEQWQGRRHTAVGRQRTAREAQAKAGRPHAPSKGDRGGGEGGSVPPDQQPEHP
ncbi:hypothetical protein ACWGQ5_07480 [Streptomyces sp. NPDC055722]